MIAVQSFWTPSSFNIQNISSLDGSWIDARYHLMGWCLSALLLKKYFGEVHLYANSDGAHILCDMLDLPYDKVYKVFDETFHERGWTLNKLYVYSLQERPFVHVDGDAFFWQKPSEAFLNAPLVGQYLELNEPIYQQCFRIASEHNIAWPSFITNTLAPFAVNAGVIGGCHPTFFKDFYQTALHFNQQHEHLTDKEYNRCGFPIIMEQCFFKYLADSMKIPITLLLKAGFKGDYSHVVEFLDICNTAAPTLFTHNVGTYKLRLFYCLQVEYWLKKHFPLYYSRVNELFPQFTPSPIQLHPLSDPCIPDFGLIHSTLDEALANRWVRSAIVLKEHGFQKDLLENDNWKVYIDEWQKDEKHQELADCILYEQQRYEKLLYRQQWPCAVPQGAFEYLFSSPIEERLHHKVRLKEDALIFRSQYNWHRPDKGRQDNEVFYEAIVDSSTGYLQEFTQNEFSIPLLQAIAEEKTLSELIEIGAHALANKSLASKRVDLRIKELFFNNQIYYTAS